MSLIAENITVRAGKKVLVDAASLSCEPGQVVVLLGPNGAGKSTLLGALIGDIRRGAGRRFGGARHRVDARAAGSSGVRLAGRSLAQWQVDQLARRRAVLRQNSHIPFAFSAREVVELGELPWQQVGAQAESFGGRPQADDYLRAVGLGELAERRYPTLSGGEARRVQLARAMLQIRALQERPVARELPGRFILLDEPLAGLDIAETSRVLGLIQQLRAREIGVICVFHDLNAAAQVADHIVLMRAGKILAQGSPAACMTGENLANCFGTSVQVTQTDYGFPRIQPVVPQFERGAVF